MKRFDPYLPVLGVLALIVLWYVVGHMACGR